MNLPPSTSRQTEAQPIAGTSSTLPNVNFSNILQRISSQLNSSSQHASGAANTSAINDEENMYLTIYKFFEQQLKENDNLSDSQKESLGVVVSCLGYSFKFYEFDQVDHSLPEIFDFFKNNKKIPSNEQNEMEDDDNVPQEYIDKADTYRIKGNELMRTKMFQKALEFYDKGLALNPKEPSLYCNRAAAYHNLNRCEDAIADCNSALSLKPEYAKAYARRGVSHEKMGDTKHALKSYKKAHLLEPDNADYKNLYTEASKKYQLHQRQDESTSASNVNANPSSQAFNMFLGPNSLQFGSLGGSQQLPDISNLMGTIISTVERQFGGNQSGSSNNSNNRDNSSYFS